jgi:hypothetical protein
MATVSRAEPARDPSHAEAGSGSTASSFSGSVCGGAGYISFWDEESGCSPGFLVALNEMWRDGACSCHISMTGIDIIATNVRLW